MVSYVSREPIDVSRLLAEVADPGLGGTVLFVGSVRRGPDDGPVRAIDYSAYEEMAASELARILSEASGRWPVARVTARHRVGRLPAGQPSVAVVAAAPHRAEAFEACRFVIEQLKRRLPIWKKEHFDDGSTEWREDAAAHPGEHGVSG